MYIISDEWTTLKFPYKSEYSKVNIKYSNDENNTDKKNDNHTKITTKITIFLFALLCIYLTHLFLILFKKYFYEHITEEANNIEHYYNICNEGKLLNKLEFQKIENPKISVITSVYNQNQYILRFLRSIQNQFFDDIEIIFVDDCSKDNSVELIKKYQKEDPR